MTILDDIIRHKKEEVRRRKRARPPGSGPPRPVTPRRDFKAALAGPGLAVIAEIKFRSPSLGRIRRTGDPARLAEGFARSGAVAVSVLTDRTYFGGRPEDLVRVKQAVAVPVLRKDFIIDPYQVGEAYTWGADAVLLIKRLLKRQQLEELLACARELGLDSLVEVSDERELDVVLGTSADIIGINNRNLKTLTVDLATSLRLVGQIPGRCIAVSESGIGSIRDLRLMRSAGFDAVLIGSALMQTASPARRLLTLTADLTKKTRGER